MPLFGGETFAFFDLDPLGVGVLTSGSFEDFFPEDVPETLRDLIAWLGGALLVDCDSSPATVLSSSSITKGDTDMLSVVWDSEGVSGVSDWAFDIARFFGGREKNDWILGCRRCG